MVELKIKIRETGLIEIGNILGKTVDLEIETFEKRATKEERKVLKLLQARINIEDKIQFI